MNRVRERDPVTGRFVGTLAQQHGTYSRYQKGCRCSRCKVANADYFRAYSERNREAMREAARRRYAQRKAKERVA